MKDRIVYLGAFNNNKQKELINKAIEYLKNNKGNEFYYLLPNGELLKKYRQDFIDKVNSTFEINLFTFDDIVNRILENDLSQKIDNPTKNLIIRESLKSLQSQGKLRYYKNFIQMEGFIHSINDIIGEIKRSLIYPEEYLDICPNKPKYKEIGYIYREYESISKEYNLCDREGQYFKSIDLLKNTSLPKELSFIIIDEFYDFRPIELAILQELIKTNIDIYINMPLDMENRTLVLDTTLKTLENLGFSIKYIEKKEKTLFEEIGFNLFSEKKEIFTPTDRLKLINGPTPYLELRRIFQEIKRIHKKGTSLQDISIILTNPEYLSSLFKVAKEEKLPITIDKTIPLKNVPIIRELLGILENKITNCSKIKLINRIKSNYFSLCHKDKREIYEYIIRKQNFNDFYEIEALLKESKGLNISLEHLRNLKEIIKIVKEELLEIPKMDTILNYNKYLLNILDKYQVVGEILERYKENQKEELFLRDLRAVNKIKEILDNMEKIPLYNEDLSIEDYYFILEEYLKEEEVLEIQGNLNGVHILNPVNSRGINKEVIFLTGLSQGSYPSLSNNSYFINDYNIKELKKIGINTKSYIERLSNEILKFASIVSSCKEQLYLSYSSGYEDISIPSMFLDELLELFKEDEDKKLERIHIKLDYLVKKQIQDISNKKDLGYYFLYKYFNEENINPNLYKLQEEINKGQIDLINRKIQGEISRSGDEYDEYSGVLEDEIIIEDIKDNLNDVFSISYLESYSRCPYYFMLNNLLEVEEMERDYEEYSPIDIGSIYHEVLRHYYQYYLIDIKEHIAEIKVFNIEDTLNFLREITYGYASQYELDLEKKKDLLIVENIVDRLMEYIHEDLARLSKWKLIPWEFEVDFGKNPRFIIQKEGEKIPMIGRIDRVDKFVDEDKYLLLDYKSSNYGIRDIEHMEKGLSLQLPIYIMSQNHKNIIVGAYGIISNGKLEIKIGILDETNIITKRNKGALSREEWDQVLEKTKDNIIDIIDNIQKGNFSVNPLECSPYCIYKDICRYEEIMEVE